ncbi:MAG: F0F1 ATP synthase subunit B [Firmicutes bacterium]|nr:F0F1 ATP synthase subunit B [Bacillota bacterium]
MVELHQGLIELNWTSLMVVLNLLILYIILKKYFWEKIRKFMTDRENAVQDAFDSAEAMNRRADEKMRNYSARIAGVEEEGREIIRQAKQQADAQAQEILADARQQASEMMVKAEKNIELEKAKAMEEMRQEIGSLALLAAEKIVGREIENVGQEAIVDDVINQARSTGWQN